MVPTFFLLACVLAPGQPPARTDWLLLPRLGRAQELVYSGTFVEEHSGSGVQFKRSYRIETRALVLDANAREAEIALLTVLRPREAAPGRHVSPGGEGTSANSVRLEIIKVDGQGRVTAEQAVPLAVPLEGPPILEHGFLVQVPRQRVAVGSNWPAAEEGRPIRKWTVAGTEQMTGVSCVKLEGVQVSDGWDPPRADRPAWRRIDTVLVAPASGVAYRVERRIERREPAHGEESYRAVLRYDLSSPPLQYPTRLFEAYRAEVLRARGFADSAAPLLSDPARCRPQLDALAGRIAYHIEHEYPTPYREAVLHVKRRVEAARRGEAPPAPLPDPAASAAALPGHKAPEFLAPSFTSQSSARLQHWLGKPIVMVFYNPHSPVAADLLRFARTISEAYQPNVIVVGLAMSDDAAAVRKQIADLHLSFPVLNGTALRQSYAVEATPKVMVLDTSGTVRGAVTGWGRETPHEVVEELKRWLPGPKPMR